MSELPIPSLSGIDRVIDFAQARARASAELAHKLNAQLAARQDTPEDERRFWALQERQKIHAAVAALVEYSSRDEAIAFLEQKLAIMGGRK